MRTNIKTTVKTARKDLPGVDFYLAVCIGAMSVIGMLMLYSASTVISFRNFGDTTHYFFHQLLYGFIPGMLLLYVLSRIDYHRWEKLIPYLAVLSLICLTLVKLPGLGFSSGGATRWIHLGFVTFQPAELAKFSIIIYTAGWVTRKQMHLKNFYLGLFPYLVVMGLFALLILWQPDVGTMLVLVMSGLSMLFIGGIRLRYFAGMGVLGGLALAIIIRLEPYRMSRLLTFLDPSRDPKGAGYQINQAMLAIGAGGLFGYGYGMSRQKHNYLPEAIGDSIFAVIAEELGFVKVSLIVLLYLTFMLRGLYVSLKAPDMFGRVLGTGIVIAIIVQAFINIGAIIGLLPLTGVTLPLISYGSSSLIMTLASLGILLNISRFAKK